MLKESLNSWKSVWKSILLFPLAGLFIYACTPPEPISDKPSITFKSLEYVNVVGDQDSLILTFDFEDGNGDLGLAQVLRFPFHDIDYVVDSVVEIYDNRGGLTDVTFRYVTYGADELYFPLRLYNKQENGFYEGSFADEDIRPEYSCEDYDTLLIPFNKVGHLNPYYRDSSSAESVDTVFIVKNPYRYNIFVDYYIDFVGNGSNPDRFELFEWEYWADDYGCGLTYDARFPIWDATSYLDENSIQGTMDYAMLGFGFENILRTRPFFLEFYIYDHSILFDEENGKSNVIRTPVYTLQDIIKQDVTQE